MSCVTNKDLTYLGRIKNRKPPKQIAILGPA